MFRDGRLSLSILTSILVLSVLPASTLSDQLPVSPPDAPPHARPKAGPLPNGLYRVLRLADSAGKLQPVGKAEELMSDDYHFLEPAEREPIRYLVLQTTPFVPFILASDPKEDREDNGKPRLQLQLAEDQAGTLEEFTRLDLGGTVAIVIGGEIVTTHKVKTVISGGRLQITRCTEHACETLFTKLLKKGG